MEFNSFHFLLFFPAVTLLYYGLPHRWRWLLLLVCSYYFYACWNVKYLALILISTGITFYTAQWMSTKASPAQRKAGLWVSLGANLGLLFFFKYVNFAIGTTAFLFSFDPFLVDILLPIGISFYTCITGNLCNFKTIIYPITTSNTVECTSKQTIFEAFSTSLNCFSRIS